jgi:hypothetical protein
MKHDEQQVIDLIEYIQNHMTDPFSIEECPKSLINIATGLHASTEVEESLLGSIVRGAKAARAKTLLKTISGFIWALITSSDRHLRLQRFVRSSIWTWKWVNKNS